MQLKRVDYWRAVRDISAKDLIFIDETGVNLSLSRLYGRSQKGRRAYGHRPQNRGKNVSVIAALGVKGLLSKVSLMGSVNGLCFEAFVGSKLVPVLWQGACVVMDNCPIHKPRVIREMIEKAGARLIYLPPYSPDLSPIENCFSKVKACLRKLAARTYPKLVPALETAFDSISNEDIRGWFTHGCYWSSHD